MEENSGTSVRSILPHCLGGIVIISFLGMAASYRSQIIQYEAGKETGRADVFVAQEAERRYHTSGALSIAAESHASDLSRAFIIGDTFESYFVSNDALLKAAKEGRAFRDSLDTSRIFYKPKFKEGQVEKN